MTGKNQKFAASAEKRGCLAVESIYRQAIYAVYPGVKAEIVIFKGQPVKLTRAELREALDVLEHLTNRRG